MLGTGHLAAVLHMVGVGEFLHPSQGGFAQSFEASWTGAWFPYAAAYQAHLRHLAERLRYFAQLLATLYATGSGNDCFAHVLVVKMFCKDTQYFPITDVNLT